MSLNGLCWGGTQKGCCANLLRPPPSIRCMMDAHGYIMGYGCIEMYLSCITGELCIDPGVGCYSHEQTVQTLSATFEHRHQNNKNHVYACIHIYI